MTPLDIFRKKERKEKKIMEAPPPKQKILLEELCGSDKELCEVLNRTILLNPEAAVKQGTDAYVEKAHGYEKAGDHVKARIAYEAAAEISLFEGNMAQTQRFFKKASEADSDYPYRKVFDFFSKKENAERALAVTREFYVKTGRLVEKKEES